MFKKFAAGAAAFALAAGISLAGTSVAGAAYSDMATQMCAVKDGQSTVSPCSLNASSVTVTEGQKLDVTVNGAEGATPQIAVFEVMDDKGSFKRISEPVAVTMVASGTGSAKGTVTISVPKLNNTQVGGKHYFVGLADTKTGDELARNFFSDLSIRSANANLSGHFAPIGNSDEWRFNTAAGIKGHEFNMQVLVNGKWVDFSRDKAKSQATDDAGYSTFYADTPKVAKGTYPVRLINLTTGAAGPEAGTLYVGVEMPKDDDKTKPSTEPSAKPSDKPSDSAKEPSKDADKKPSKDSDKKPSKDSGKKPGKKPALPKTGV